MIATREIRPIKTTDDYEEALREIDGLMDAEPDTPEGDRLDVLRLLSRSTRRALFLCLRSILWKRSGLRWSGRG